MHVVCQWIGNSQAIAAKHYLQVTDEHFERAVGDAVQNSVQYDAVSSENGDVRESENCEIPEEYETLRPSTDCKAPRREPSSKQGARERFREAVVR